jgi:hypothetical protein
LVIAKKLEWQGDAGALVEALVASRWLDIHPEHRLIIHHWPEHCEDSTHTHLARQVMHFADGSRPKMARLPEKERAALIERFEAHESAQKRSEAPTCADERSTLPLPEPVPVPLPEPDIPPPAAKRRATRIPEDFAVTEEHRRFAKENGLPNPDSEIDRFRDHWSAKAGKDAVKLDWDATFRNWLRNATAFTRSSPAKPERPWQPRAQSMGPLGEMAYRVESRYGIECGKDAAAMIERARADGFFAAESVTPAEVQAELESWFSRVPQRSQSGAAQRISQSRGAFGRAAERSGGRRLDGFAGIVAPQDPPENLERRGPPVVL